MSDINEKISALYDGELDQAEIDNLLEVVDSDKISQERLSFFSDCDNNSIVFVKMNDL